MTFQDFKSKYQKAPVEEYPNEVTDKPVVSVCVMTYQHKDYIRECLDGILMQKTDFSCEILLGEDVSTDGTREICIEYAERYPDIIRLFLHDRANNIAIGGHPTGRFNFLYNLHTARGKYIALCEGDDYWTDPLKLQKQVDFLEENPEYSLCFHNAEVFNERYNDKTKKYNLIKATNKIKYTTSDILKQWFIPTASIVFRKKMLTLPEWFFNMSSGDIALVFLLSLKGPLYYLDETMAIYRIHNKGISATHTSLKKVMDMAYMYKTFDIYSEYKFSDKIKKAFEQECQTHIIKKAKEDYREVMTNQLQLQFINETSNNLKKLDGLISLKNLFKLILFKMKKSKI